MSAGPPSRCVMRAAAARSSFVKRGFMRCSGSDRVSAPTSSPAAFHTGAEMPMSPGTRSPDTTM